VDASSQAVVNATDSGVTAVVTAHLAHVELLQGLITFSATPG
jgi:hypothetical protein